MPITEILSPFERFDPIQGHPSHHFFDVAERIANRARRLLKGRTREQILYLVESINFMVAYRDPLSARLDTLDEDDQAADVATVKQGLDTAQSQRPTLDQRPGLVAAQVKTHPDHGFDSPAQALSRCMHVFDITAQTELSDAKWSEYFAALALALIGESMHIPPWAAKKRNTDAVRRDLSESHYVAPYLFDAMEALSRAELLREQQSHEAEIQAVKEKVRLNHQKGGINRNAATNRVKRDFIRFVEESYRPALRHGERLNQSAAAREYYDEFLADRAPDPSEDYEGAYRHRKNWLRKLTDTLRDYLNTGEPSPLSQNTEE